MQAASILKLWAFFNKSSVVFKKHSATYNEKGSVAFSLARNVDLRKICYDSTWIELFMFSNQLYSNNNKLPLLLNLLLLEE